MTSHDPQARSRSRIGRRGVVLGALLIVAAIAVVVVVLMSVTSSSPLRTEGASISHLTIASRFVHGKPALTLVTPAGGGAHRPLLVFLHGHCGDNNWVLSDQLFTALRALGTRAPDVAFPLRRRPLLLAQPRRRGMGSYVLEEVIPKGLTVLGADPRRMAIGGIATGGFGGLRSGPSRPGQVLRRRRGLARDLV